METTGFNSGYLNALQVISGVANVNSEIETRAQGLAQAKERNDQYQGYLDRTLDFKMQQQQIETNKEAQSRSILANVFQAQNDRGLQTDYLGANDALVGQYRQAGKALLPIDPQTGLSLMREADSLNYHNTSERLKLTAQNQDKTDRMYAFAGMVQDQTGLDEFINMAAKNGQPVPDQYKTWSPATESWLERQMTLALPASKSLTLQQRQQRIDLAAQRQAEQERINNEKLAQHDRDTAQKRESANTASVNKTINLSVPKSELALLGEEKALQDMDPTGVVKDLTDGMMRKAVLGVYTRAQDLARANPGKPATEILAQAQKDVIARVVPGEGWAGKATYLGFDSESPTAATPTQKEQPKTISAPNGVTYVLQPNGRYLPAKGVQ